jgi:hypothetical protein
MTPELIAERYRVVRAVGSGGMGTVWLCRDEVLGREVAVKRIGMMPGESATDAARALREARSSAALNHRNVVSVFDVVDSGDGPAWLVMEYVPSRTLAQIVREDGPLEPRRAAGIGAQVADGLAAAHAAGTVHRDVKPGNILVTDEGVAKISDFGIARMADGDQLTRTGLVTGTPSYFSPELARGADPGPESDVYALGATLYTAVQGVAPYPEQRNAIALLQQIAAEQPPQPDRAGALADAITRMMDRDPARRWSMADAAHALHRVADRAGAADDPPTAVLPRATGAGAFGAGAVGAGAVGAGAVGAGAAGAGAAGAGAAGGPPGTDPATGADAPGAPGDEDRRRGGRWLVAGAVLLLLLLAGVGYALLGAEPERSPQAGSPPTASGTPDRGPSPTPRRSPSPSPAEETPEQDDTPTPSPSTEGAAPVEARQAQEDVVEEYFSLVPDDTDAAWELLAPSMQAQGREAYDAWWDSVDEVELQQVQATGGDPTVDIRITYFFEDGSTTRERQRLTLERSGDRYLIADDEVLSSRTTS